jgi:hypothetical protein
VTSYRSKGIVSRLVIIALVWVFILPLYALPSCSKFSASLLWAACCLAYFGFLRSSEFTVPNGATFSQALHLSVHDIAADQRVAPSKDPSEH